MHRLAMNTFFPSRNIISKPKLTTEKACIHLELSGCSESLLAGWMNVLASVEALEAIVENTSERNVHLARTEWQLLAKDQFGNLALLVDRNAGALQLLASCVLEGRRVELKLSAIQLDDFDRAVDLSNDTNMSSLNIK